MKYFFLLARCILEVFQQNKFPRLPNLQKHLSLLDKVSQQRTVRLTSHWNQTYLSPFFYFDPPHVLLNNFNNQICKEKKTCKHFIIFDLQTFSEFWSQTCKTDSQTGYHSNMKKSIYVFMSRQHRWSRFTGFNIYIYFFSISEDKSIFWYVRQLCLPEAFQPRGLQLGPAVCVFI